LRESDVRCLGAPQSLSATSLRRRIAASMACLLLPAYTRAAAITRAATAAYHAAATQIATALPHATRWQTYQDVDTTHASLRGCAYASWRWRDHLQALRVVALFSHRRHTDHRSRIFLRDAWRTVRLTTCPAFALNCFPLPTEDGDAHAYVPTWPHLAFCFTSLRRYHTAVAAPHTAR